MNSTLNEQEHITFTHDIAPEYEKILTPEALAFVAHLHQKFNPFRMALLEARKARQKELDDGIIPDFLEETLSVRESNWQVAQIPHDLQDRRTEITGPVDRKMVINALNSGAKVFMADFEDANSPTWNNCMNGQVNLYDAVRKQIDFIAPNGKSYELQKETAVLKVRPRGWHLDEKHMNIDGTPISASIFDFGLYFYHNAQELVRSGSGPYFYLPKLENHLEARLWNDIFKEAQQMLGFPQGTIKVTVLIETILAAFEMEEIIYELRKHLAGLNAGRWDYIFSVIKKFGKNKHFLLPDRGQVTMTVPFMSAYAQLLVKTCHKRGAHAIGGMSAFIPSKDPETNRIAFEKVSMDKHLEASHGYDGTWVAHPGLVSVAMEEFNNFLGKSKHQKTEMREDVNVTAMDLLNMKIPEGKVTQTGIRQNINVAIKYIESWLSGTGAAALNNLMEDAATAEISRAQVWQWLHLGISLDDGRRFNFDLYQQMLEDEKAKIMAEFGEDRIHSGKLLQAVTLFDLLVRRSKFTDFLTIEAYQILN